MENKGVLFMAVSAEWGDRKALVARTWGKDFYGVWFDDRYLWLGGWDENDEFFFLKDLTNPTKGAIKMPRRPQLYDGTTVFTGGYVEPDVWERARQVFDAEMF